MDTTLQRVKVKPRARAGQRERADGCGLAARTGACSLSPEHMPPPMEAGSRRRTSPPSLEEMSSTLRPPGEGTASPPVPPLQSGDGRAVSVVHLVAELAPFARTGGLGEAVASLARHQLASGIATSLVMPLYGIIRTQGHQLEAVGDPFAIEVGGRQHPARLLRLVRPSTRSAEP